MSASDLQTIKNYIKTTNCIDSTRVEVSYFPQSKFYLKKQIHIFNNTVLASKPHVIKVFPKSDMDIVWLDIWDVQSESKAKYLINRYFNIGNYIATIKGANMNPSVFQYKNC